MYFDGHLFTDSGWVSGQWNLTPVISPVDEIPAYSQVLSGWAAPAFADVTSVLAQLQRLLAALNSVNNLMPCFASA